MNAYLFQYNEPSDSIRLEHQCHKSSQIYHFFSVNPSDRLCFF